MASLVAVLGAVIVLISGADLKRDLNVSCKATLFGTVPKHLRFHTTQRCLPQLGSWVHSREALQVGLRTRNYPCLQNLSNVLVDTVNQVVGDLQNTTAVYTAAAAKAQSGLQCCHCLLLPLLVALCLRKAWPALPSSSAGLKA